MAEQTSKATSEDAEKSSSFLYVQAKPADKAAWTMAARRRGQKLAVWVTETLNAATKDK